MVGFIDGELKISATEYAVLLAGTANPEVLQSIDSVGTAGQILTSQGSSAKPSMEDPAEPSITPSWTAWSPTIRGSTTAGTGTYTFQAGHYLVLNTTCFVKGLIGWTALTGDAGNPCIGNLPFTIKNVTDNNHSWVVQSTNWGTGDPNTAITSIGNTFSTLYSLSGSVSTRDTSATLWFSGFYEVA